MQNVGSHMYLHKAVPHSDTNGKQPYPKQTFDFIIKELWKFGSQLSSSHRVVDRVRP